MMINESDICFKSCTMCGHHWPQRDQFLSDPDIQLIGYMPVFRDLNSGLLMFNHHCRTTLSLTVGTFVDLVDGPTHPHPKTGSDQCPGHCLRKDALDPCDAQCRCTYVRAMMQIIRNWPKWAPAKIAASG